MAKAPKTGKKSKKSKEIVPEAIEIVPEQEKPPALRGIVNHHTSAMAVAAEALHPEETVTVFSLAWVGADIHYCSNTSAAILNHALEQAREVIATDQNIKQLPKGNGFAWVNPEGVMDIGTVTSSYLGTLATAETIYLGKVDNSGMPPEKRLEKVQAKNPGTILKVSLKIEM